MVVVATSINISSGEKKWFFDGYNDLFVGRVVLMVVVGVEFNFHESERVMIDLVYDVFAVFTLIIYLLRYVRLINNNWTMHQSAARKERKKKPKNYLCCLLYVWNVFVCLKTYDTRNNNENSNNTMAIGSTPRIKRFVYYI